MSTMGLTIRVGVTGHRQIDASQLPRVRQQVRDALQSVKAAAALLHRRHATLFGDEAPTLRVVSSLAEGADQLVAEEAMAMGYALECPLPFERATLMSTLADTRFEELLSKADAVMELDGDPDAVDGAPYETCAHVMLEQSDILIGIWDGNAGRGLGGTAAVVAEADELEIPVVHIDSRHETAVQMNLCDRGMCDFDEARFVDRVTEMLAPPSHEAGADPHPALEFVRELEGASQTASISPRGLPFEAALAPYRPYFHAADRLAIHFARWYRYTSMLNYVLAALAASVAIGLLLIEGQAAASGHHPPAVPWLLGIELGLVAAIVVFTQVARRRGWHRRAIDYRFLAEQFRQMLILAPLGYVTPVSRPPLQYADGDPRSTWMNWMLRRVVGRTGMPDVRLTASYRAALREYLVGVALRSQTDFHRNASAVGRRTHALLHHLGTFFFAVAALAILLHVGVLLGLLDWSGPILTVFSATCPAWGGAMLAVDNQGEYERMARRYRAMATHLESVQRDIAAQDADASSAQLVPLVRTAAQSMIDEVVDWRIVFKGRPLRLPA